MDDLEKQLRDKVREVDAAQKALDALRDEEQALRKAIGNRAIDVFWKQNEGLRLNVGDKIVITAEYLQWYEKSTQQYPLLHAGQCLIIDDLYIEADELRVGTDHMWLGITPLDIARRMRIAYLQAHGEAEGG